MNQVRELLEKAAEILERDGHCKGAFTNDDGEHCALGALYKASGLITQDCCVHFPTAVQEAAYDALQAQIPGEAPVMHYNDAASTTTEDVLLLFKRAAASTTE